MWALGITAPNREFVVARTLAKWKFHHHLFKIVRRTVFRGFALDRVVPAFPSYIFVHVSDGCWTPLREVFGITDFVKQEGRIAELPVSTLYSLLKLAGPGDVLPVADPPQRFRMGDRVAIRGMSLLSGQVAIFQHAVDRGQAIVLIDWMGRWVPIGIDERDLCAEAEFKRRPTSRGRRRLQARRAERRAPSSRTEWAVAG